MEPTYQVKFYLAGVEFISRPFNESKIDEVVEAVLRSVPEGQVVEIAPVK